MTDIAAQPALPMVRARHDTAYGSASLELLRARVAHHKSGDPLRPVTVVVPTNTVGVEVRRRLARDGSGVIGLQVLTVRRLAELLGAPILAAHDRQPSSPPVVAAAVRQELAADPLVFAPVAEHPATVESLVRAHAELRDVSDAGLERLAGEGPRARDVVAMHRRVVARLATDFYDDVDLYAAASHQALDSTVVADLGLLLLHLPQRLSRAAADFLTSIPGSGIEVVAGWTGHEDADRDVRRSLERLGLSGTTTISANSPDAIVRIITVSDQDEESRVAVDMLLEHARRGVSLDRMAVLVPSAVPYARLVHEAMDDAGLVVNGMGSRPVSDRHVGRWVLDLLDQVDGRRERAPVMGLLLATQAPVAGQYAGSAASWIAASRDAGIVAGTDEWTMRLVRHRQYLVGRRRSTAGVDGLGEAIADLFTLLDRLAAARTWPDLTSVVAVAVADWLGDPTERDRWPAEERQAADRVSIALDRLAGLDRIEQVATAADLRRTLKIELEGDLGRVGQLGRGVHLAPITSALGLDLDLVVVLGLAEGVFPTPTSEDALLLDHEREPIGEELPARRERVGTQHRQFRIAAASAGTCVFITPRGDLRTNADRVPSRWLRDHFARADADADNGVTVTAMPSFAHRILTAEVPSSLRDARVRELGQEAASGSVGAATRLYGMDLALRAATDLVLARRAPGFGRHDGNLAGVADMLPQLVGADVAVSPTHLERWVRCPHAAFITRVLWAQPVENPEERLAISAMDRGSAVHDILERWLVERLAETLPDPDDPWSPPARARLLAIAAEHFADIEASGITGHGLLWARDRARLEHELTMFLEADDQRRATSGLTPHAAELSFGRADDQHPPARVRLHDGRELCVTGKIDRVDVDREGRMVVSDYKTGSTRGYENLDKDDVDPVLGGQRLQLATYALGVAGSGARNVRAEYWFTSARGGFERIGYVVDDHVVDSLRDAASQIVALWEAGVFVGVPISPDDGKPWIDCDVCDPDGLGTGDVHARWQGLATGPELRGFVRLRDPEFADELDAYERGGVA